MAKPFADETGFESTEQRLKDQGLDSRPREVFWTLAIEGLVAAIASGIPSRMAETYRYLAAVSRRQAGDLPTMSGQTAELLAGANRATLHELIARGVERVEVRPDRCQRCQRDQGARLDPRSELAATRLPHVDCELGSCSCEYVPSTRALRVHRPVAVMLAGTSQRGPRMPPPLAARPATPATEIASAAQRGAVFRLPDETRPLRAVGPGRVTVAPEATPLDCAHCADSRARGAAFCRACGRALREAPSSSGSGPRETSTRSGPRSCR